MEHYPTVKAFEIKSVRIRMEARREAQSEAWEAILRTAGGHVDFDRDDLLALENRAQADWVRVCKAKAAEKAREETEDRARVTRAAEKAREEKEDRARATGAAKRAREEKEDREQRAAEYRENMRRHAELQRQLSPFFFLVAPI